MKLMIMNGPNINFLGIREPHLYGNETYEDLCNQIKEHAQKINVEVQFYQSNHEGDLVDKIQECYFQKIDGIVFNPAAYTHTSVALLDALKAVKIPCVEVHISKVNEREDFRQISYVSLIAVHRIIGRGFLGYLEAMDYLKENYQK